MDEATISNIILNIVFILIFTLISIPWFALYRRNLKKHNRIVGYPEIGIMSFCLGAIVFGFLTMYPLSLFVAVFTVLPWIFIMRKIWIKKYIETPVNPQEHQVTPQPQQPIKQIETPKQPQTPPTQIPDCTLANCTTCNNRDICSNHKLLLSEQTTKQLQQRLSELEKQLNQ